MYAQNQIRPGQVLAGLGGFGVVVSLWLHWYTVTIGANVREALHGLFGGITGPLGSLDSVVDRLPSHVGISGWTALAQADTFLALLGGAVVAATLLAGSAGEVAGRATAIAGAIATAICLQHVLSPPGPGGLASPALGAWLALAGSTAMMAGGFHAASQPTSAPSRPAGPAPAGEPRFDATTSVAPPTTTARMTP